MPRRSFPRLIIADLITKVDTGGEVIVQAWNGEMFLLNRSMLFDFATSIS
jgi:hypothetical protein